MCGAVRTCVSGLHAAHSARAAVGGAAAARRLWLVLLTEAGGHRAAYHVQYDARLCGVGMRAVGVRCTCGPATQASEAAKVAGGQVK